jgi:hypothetical protein
MKFMESRSQMSKVLTIWLARRNIRWQPLTSFIDTCQRAAIREMRFVKA